MLFICGALAIALVIRELFFAKRSAGPMARPSEPISFRPLAARQPHAGPLFERLPAATIGIDFTSKIETNHPLKFLYETGFSGGGVDKDKDKKAQAGSSQATP